NQVVITPLSPWGTNGGWIIGGDRKTYTNSSAGSLIVSGISTPGAYQVVLHGRYTTTTVTNFFPATNGAINAANYLAPYAGTAGYGVYNGTYGGNANGLSNANASALFAIGTVPYQFLPPYLGEIGRAHV